MRRVVSFIFIITLVGIINSEDIHLKLPRLLDSPNQHLYFYELLEVSLEHSGHNVTIESIEIPQQRFSKYLESGKLSLVWWIESRERSRMYSSVDINLTNNLIGKRVLLIPPENQHIYDNVETLDDLRSLDLVGAMGVGWYDSLVWDKNGLKYKEHRGDRRDIFLMLSEGRRYDYFSRGINEIEAEKEAYLDLIVEENLLLVYERDFKFYLSHTGENNGFRYADILEESLKRARDAGIIDDLINKYWSFIYTDLNYRGRRVINLETP